MIKTNPKKVKDFFETSHQNIVIDDTRKDLLAKKLQTCPSWLRLELWVQIKFIFTMPLL